MTDKTYFRIAAEVLNKPLLCEPLYARVALNVLGSKLGFAGVIDDIPDSLQQQHAESDLTPPEERYLQENETMATWMLRDDGTAVVNIKGTLWPGKGPAFASMGAGYKTIAANIRAAYADARTDRVALMVNSPGGVVSGCSACGDIIYDLAQIQGDKPIWAYVDETAASAAYWLPAQANRIIGPDTMVTGSIGVIRTHASYEKALESRGVKITMITSGDKKAMGNEYTDLSEADLEEMTAQVTKLGGLFHQAVSRGRPDLSVEQVADQQAGVYFGDDGVKAGLADDVMNLDDFFYAFSQEKPGSTSVYIDDGKRPALQAEVSTTAGEATTNNSQEIDSTMTKAELEELKAKAAKADKLEQDKAEAESRAEKAEKAANDAKAKASAKHDRYVAVMESDAAVGREDKAKELLADDMFAAFTADQLTAHLENFAKAEQKDEDEVPGEDVAKMLAIARASKSDTGDITNRGDSDAEDEDKAEEKTGIDKYSTSVSSNSDEMMADFLASARIVKANKMRKRLNG